MLGRLLGLGGHRVSTLADWHPGVAAKDADMESLLNELIQPSHPALQQICALILSIPEGGHPTGEDRNRIYTLVIEGRSQEAEKFLVETLLRLPFATAICRANAGRVRFMKDALDLCLVHCAHLWAVPDREIAEVRLGADDAATALRSMASLYHPDRTYCSIFTERLTLALCRVAWRHRSPACLEAIQQLFENFARHQIYTKDMCYRLAEKIVAITEQPRSSVAILAAFDQEFGHRLAARRKVGAAAGEVLAPLLDAVFDDPGHLGGYKTAQAAEHPAMAALLQQDAETLGAALLTLIRIVDSREQFGISAWSALSRRQGFFELQHSNNSTAETSFENIAALLLRRKLALSDAEVAALVNAVPRHRGLQSRHMLNLAVKAVEAHPGGASENALRQLAKRQPVNNKAPMPCEWKADLDRLFAGSGAGEPDAAPLDLPKVDITEYRAVEQLAQHFANLFDRRLHDPRHTQFLAGLEAAAEALIRERQQAAPALYARVLRPNMTEQEVAAAYAQAAHHDIERNRRWIDRALAAGAELLKQLSAVSPFVSRHWLVADRLGGLCLAVRNKSAPPQKWQDEGAKLMAALPEAERLDLLSTLIGATTPSPALGLENEHMLRGVIYLAARWDASTVAPLLTEFALRKCYQTEAGRGIKGEKLGNACLWTLIHMPDGAGVPYLARLLARIKYPKIRAKIDAALNEAAEKAGITRAALDELSVPSHGLNESGETEFEVGGGRAVIALVGNRQVETRWYTPEGKQAKSPTVAMKEDKEALKEVKQAAKEIEADLATQIIRLQRLYLEDMSWPADVWRERYAEHPLLRALASRLIWWVDRNGQRTSALARDGRLADLQGATVELEGARIRLWHPIDDEAAAVMAWRDRIESLQIVQPFAQAWREIYRLTDAERTTGTYSNRWAGHILKQHQCMTLARLNGWTVTHRMWVDAPNDAPWHRLLPAHGLVADYWVEGAGDRDSPDVLDSAAYAYISTDRLKFCRIADPAAAKDSAYGPDRYEDVALQDVPAVVFSEIMRHCDLFTAVASIASDPEWRDRGAEIAHPNQWRRDAEAYWARSSFSDLSGSGATRRELLQRLIPRMAIADRCSFDEQALVVRGKRHVYRIHLGSAAVQIAPTRQHVCIVAKSEPANEKVLLPFEGDTTLSLILSKAFLLAADDKITDLVILRQL